MSSSKRKFNTLLNGLGNRSTSSLADINNSSKTARSLQNDNDAIAKRLRTDHTGKIRNTDASIRKTTLSRTSPDMSHRKTASEASAPLSRTPVSVAPLPDEGPKYNPYDREAFLARLKSYSRLLDWSQKPDKVEAVEWAKRGWVCKKNERVRCDYCYIELVVKVNVKVVDGVEQKVYVASNIDEAIVNKYADLIVTAHSETCPWRQRGCGDSIFHLTLNNASTTIKALRDRYDSLCVMSDKLPYLHNMHLPADYNLDTVLGYLPKDFFTIHTGDMDGDNSPKANRVAIIMALCGWYGDRSFSVKNGAATCSSCFRHLGLWIYKSKEVSEDGNIIRSATYEYLDPIAQHRDYCPWKSGNSQSGFSKHTEEPLLAAWQIIIRVLKNNHYLTQTAVGESSTRTSNTAKITESIVDTDPGREAGEEDDEKTRDEKDKRRQGRLSRIKSLFDVKNGTKLQRSSIVASKEAPI